MRLSWQDRVATALVFGAGLLYVLWVTGSAFGALSTTAASAAVFGLGFVACVSDQGRMALMYGPRGDARPSTAYVATATLVGLLALVTGLVAMLAGDGVMLAVLVASILALWVMATTAHRTEVLARSRHTTVHRPV